jgi:hypothetical protein
MLAYDPLESEANYNPRLPELIPEFSLVPWKSEDAGKVDGRMKDIWEIVLDIYLYPEIHKRNPCFVCVDRQFEIDQTLIVVVADEYRSNPGHNVLQHLPFPSLKGFRYMRSPAHLVYSGNRNWVKDHGNSHEWLTYRRQGWL